MAPDLPHPPATVIASRAKRGVAIQSGVLLRVRP